VDAHGGRLLRQGEVVRLQEQPFQVLVALLERHGEIVMRHELRARLWPADTFVEFDKSLGVALTKVRAALGDDAGNPRFVETVPRRGYRFIAPVAVETADRPTSLERAEPERPGVPSASTSSPAPLTLTEEVAATRFRPRVLGLLSAIIPALVVIVAILFVMSRRQPKTAAPRRVAVVVAEFTNGTADPVFGGSLRRAAATALRQSPFLSVMTDPLVADTLQALGRAPTETLTAPLARDVCTHARSQVLIDGDVSLAADTYTLVVEATRCADGGAIARAAQTFTRKDDALAVLGREIERVRAALGESRASLRAYDAPLSVATTESLEALRAFDLGLDLRLRADDSRAIPAFQTAISLDPHFALAYVELGSAYSNIGDEADGAPYLVKAFDLRDRVTEPERLSITGRYFDVITREMEKAIENYRLWTSVYPDEWQPFNGLANDADLIGRYDVAAPAAARALALDDTQLFPRVNLMTADCALNKFAECLDQARRILARTPDDSSAHLVLYVLARHAGDEAAAEREVAWAAQHPSDSGVLYVEAEDAGLHGRFAEMTRLFRQVARLVRDGGNAEGAGNTLAYSAVINSLAGRFGDAQTDANAAAAAGRNEIILGSVGIVAARAGRMEAADQSLATMNRLYPLSTYALGMYGPYVRCVELAQKPASAADVTRATAAGESYAFGQQGSLNLPYLCGLAYMAAHAPDRAAVDFQQLIDHVGVDPLSPLYAMSYLGLARANAAMGKWDESRRAYETLRGLWADADRDALLVRAAMSETSAARRSSHSRLTFTSSP
jgi:DNA-binding winged helix-turn-helix (wHTH) protein/tetratricopeptide (TPR) repeat protein